MSQKSKLIKRFLEKPKDFTWNELTRLLQSFGYEIVKQGKTGGSRRRFVHSEYNFITLHEPHPIKVLKRYQLEQVINCLQEEGLL